MMSSDRDLGFEFASFGIAYWFRSTQSELSLAWCQHTKRCVRAVEIVPDHEALQSFLNRGEVGRYD